MKNRTIIVTAMLSIFALVSGNCLAASDFTEADRMYREEKLKECEKELQTQLSNATTPAERAEAYWRLARLQVIYGESITSKEERRPLYTKGKEYSEKAIAEDPKNPYGYMWHSANVGREAQTKGMSDQIKIVPIVTGDLTTIMDKLGKTDISEAWQAMSEMFYRHPFKSNDAAVNYGRKAMMCIPADESRFSSYAYFAELLYSRGNSASKRKSAIDGSAEDFKKTTGSNLEKYAYFEGSLGSSYVPKWSTKSLGSMSDREEAMAIIDYAIQQYNKKAAKTPRDNEDYKVLAGYKEKWK